MSATADIITAVKEDALSILIQSVKVRQEGWEDDVANKKRGRCKYSANTVKTERIERS